MTWRVQISGDALDLNALSQSFTDDDLRIVGEEREYFLEVNNFERATILMKSSR